MRNDEHAFPLSWLEAGRYGDIHRENYGMSTRTLLAGLLMAGELANGRLEGPLGTFAARAVAAADALLDELEKPPRTATEVE